MQGCKIVNETLWSDETLWSETETFDFQPETRPRRQDRGYIPGSISC